MKTINSLMKRWLRKTGEPMPESVQRLPLDRVEFAVQRVEAGDAVVVPPDTKTETPREGFGCGDSMREWDVDGFY